MCNAPAPPALSNRFPVSLSMKSRRNTWTTPPDPQNSISRCSRSTYSLPHSPPYFHIFLQYETPAEHLGDTQDPEKSLSRCSTAKGNLSRMPDAFLSSREASAAVAAAAAGASSGKATKGGVSVSLAGGRVWMGRSRRPGSRCVLGLIAYVCVVCVGAYICVCVLCLCPGFGSECCFS